MKKGYLIPWKKNMPENWKTAEELLIADRGGLVLEPVVGLHEDVVELDYASLYPNIMVLHNISPETMLCSCCPDSTHRVPQLGYHICVRQKGLLPEVLEPIIQRRFCFKARAKNKQYDHEMYTELQKAWKWVLVVCFGYTGYRNARYGRIECHESITAYSRDILLTAAEVAQQAGYEVLHGIIDSLWVKGAPGCARPFRLSRLISTRTGIRMDVEGRYQWIVFLPSKGTGVGALTRYYGLFENGTVKIRGVELRQHNTPVFLKHAQQEMLSVFTQAGNAEEFRALIPKSVEVLRRSAAVLRDGAVCHKDLVFTTTVSRDIAQYKVNTLAKSALLQLQDQGVHVEPGQSVRYLVTDEYARNYKRRVCIAEKMQGSETVDVAYYLRQLAKCGESLLTPFGYTIEKLKEVLD
jgi:DNA polymerase elongation subunit (family B)